MQFSLYLINNKTITATDKTSIIMSTIPSPFLLNSLSFLASEGNRKYATVRPIYIRRFITQAARSLKTKENAREPIPNIIEKAKPQPFLQSHILESSFNILTLISNFLINITQIKNLNHKNFTN